MAKKIQAKPDDDMLSDLIGFATAPERRAAERKEEKGKAKSKPDDEVLLGRPMRKKKDGSYDEVGELARQVLRPKGYKVVNVRVPAEVHAAFRMAAAREELKFPQMLERLLRTQYPDLFDD